MFVPEWEMEIGACSLKEVQGLLQHESQQEHPIFLTVFRQAGEDIDSLHKQLIHVCLDFFIIIIFVE